MQRLGVVTVVLLFGALAHADEVRLKDGAVLHGDVIVERHRVLVTTDAGAIAVARSEVDRLERTGGPLTEFERRHETLRSDDVAGRIELARWAKAQRLHQHERRLMEEIILIEPDHAEAREALGHHLIDGQWLSDAEYHERQGLVWADGRWVAPVEAERQREALYQKAKSSNTRSIEREKARARTLAQQQRQETKSPAGQTRGRRAARACDDASYLPGETHADWWRRRARGDEAGRRPSDLSEGDWCYGATCDRSHPNQRSALNGGNACYGATCDRSHPNQRSDLTGGTWCYGDTCRRR